MTTTRRLSLRVERLAELTAPQLRQVAGAGADTRTCPYTVNVKECVSHAMSCPPWCADQTLTCA